jgi:hypothetical protein
MPVFAADVNLSSFEDVVSLRSECGMREYIVHTVSPRTASKNSMELTSRTATVK